MNLKYCIYCNQEKSLEEFPSKKKGSGSRCKLCINLWAKENYKKNKEKIIKSRETHKKDIIKRRNWYREWENNKIKNDSKYKIIKRLRRRHNGVLKGELSTSKSLGCTSEKFKNYIQSLFSNNMSWENYGFGKGKWCIDHIIPISALVIDIEGNIEKSELNLKILHYTNMQPLWFEENMKKSNKM